MVSTIFRFLHLFYVTWSNLTSIFQMGWNHPLPSSIVANDFGFCWEGAGEVAQGLVSNHWSCRSDWFGSVKFLGYNSMVPQVEKRFSKRKEATNQRLCTTDFLCILRWRLRRSLEDKAMTVGVPQSLRHGQPLHKELTSTFYMCWGLDSHDFHILGDGLARLGFHPKAAGVPDGG